MRLLTALQGTAFIATFFFVLPAASIALNDRAGWPRWESGFGSALGTGLIIAGIGVVLYCSQAFRRIGQGTPVPSEPPTRLVVSGLYRFSRNPIYVADVVILTGVFLVQGHLALLVYAGVLFVLIEAWIVWYEEPVLVKRFGAESSSRCSRSRNRT